MKILSSILLGLFSLNAYSAPIFEIEKLNFMYSEGTNENFLGTYENIVTPQVEVLRTIDVFSGETKLDAITSISSAPIADSISNTGMMWFDSALNIYAIDLGNNTGPVKLLDSSVMQSLETAVNPNGSINGLFSYGSNTGEFFEEVNDYVDIASPDESSVFKSFIGYSNQTLSNPNSVILDCFFLSNCTKDVVGLSYVDTSDDGQFNGDLLYLLQNEDGSMMDEIMSYNWGSSGGEVYVWSSLSALGITEDMAPTRGFTFFNTNDLSLGNGPVVEVTEPGAAGLLAVGIVTMLGARRRKSGGLELEQRRLIRRRPRFMDAG